jgi:hypothetical protein
MLAGLRMGTNYDLKGLALRINASPFNALSYDTTIKHS